MNLSYCTVRPRTEFTPSGLCRSLLTPRADTNRLGPRGHEARELCTIASTVAEIRYGIERLPGGRRKEALRATAAEIFVMFPDQVLSLDVADAEQYALVVSERDGLGLPIAGSMRRSPRSAVRAGRPWLRATWLTSAAGVDVINPWQAGS